MTTTEYRIQLDIFEGPLDLLVYLVRKHEVDPVEIRVASITSQFLEFLEVLEILNFEMVGDFVVMASTLVEIKSRLVLPTADEDDEEAELVEESNSDLIRQLLRYKSYKDAARALEDRAAEWQDRYPRLSDDRPRVGKDPATDRIREVELWDLVSALSRILKRRDVEEEASIRYDDTPIGVHQERIRNSIAQNGESRFSEFFDGEKFQSRIVGIFLAILELVRHHGYRAHQPVDYGEIWIRPPLAGHEPEPESEPTTPAGELTLPVPDDNVEESTQNGEQ